MPTRYAFGWKREEFDRRDKMFAPPLDRSRILTEVDTRPNQPPIWDQGQTSSCTGHGVGSGIAYRRIRQGCQDAKRKPSVLALYYNARELEGTEGSDDGAYIRDVIRQAKKLGAPFEDGPDGWPFDPHKVTTKPPPNAYEAGLNEQLVEGKRIAGGQLAVDYCRLSLSEDYPVAFGSWLYESFMSAAVSNTGIIPMPEPHESIVGGHCMSLVGHHDPSRMFIGRNSWGRDWGMEGYFMIPYDYIGTSKLTSDLWSVREVEA